MSEHIGTITEHSIEEGKKGEYHKITVEPEKWTYNVFDEKLFPLCKKGKGVKVVYQVEGKFHNIESIEEVKQPEAPEPHGNGKSDMTKEDWAAKDRRIARLTIAKAVIESRSDFFAEAADRAFNWVYELPQNPPTKPQEGKQVATKDEDITIGQMMSKVYSHWQAKKIEHDEVAIKKWVGNLVPDFTGLGMIKDKALMKKLYDKAMSETMKL